MPAFTRTNLFTQLFWIIYSHPCNIFLLWMESNIQVKLASLGSDQVCLGTDKILSHRNKLFYNVTNYKESICIHGFKIKWRFFPGKLLPDSSKTALFNMTSHSSHFGEHLERYQAGWTTGSGYWEKDACITTTPLFNFTWFWFHFSRKPLEQLNLLNLHPTFQHQYRPRAAYNILSCCILVI